MTIGGAIAELQNLLNADDVPFYYKGGIEKVIETIQMEMADRKTEPQKDCKKCKNYDRCKNNRWKCCVYEPMDEPQTQKPCDNCQEFDCYGCEYKQMKGSE